MSYRATEPARFFVAPFETTCCPDSASSTDRARGSNHANRTTCRRDSLVLELRTASTTRRGKLASRAEFTRSARGITQVLGPTICYLCVRIGQGVYWRRGRDCPNGRIDLIKSKTYCDPDGTMCTNPVPRSRADFIAARFWPWYAQPRSSVEDTEAQITRADRNNIAVGQYSARNPLPVDQCAIGTRLIGDGERQIADLLHDCV